MIIHVNDSGVILHLEHDELQLIRELVDREATAKADELTFMIDNPPDTTSAGARLGFELTKQSLARQLDLADRTLVELREKRSR